MARAAAKAKKVDGFHSHLLSLTKKGIETRATYVFLLFVALVAMNSIVLIGSSTQVAHITLGITLSVTLTLGFLMYDVLYNLLVRGLPLSYNVDRLVLFGSQAVLLGLIIPTILYSWLAGSGAFLSSTFLMGEVWLGVFAVVLLVVRFVGGYMQRHLHGATKNSKKATPRRRI